jgi:protein-S-isoprenylcysteine O-methyltransferase Ste14
LAAAIAALIFLRGGTLEPHVKAIAVAAVTAAAMILVDRLFFRTDRKASAGLLPRAGNPVSIERVTRKFIGFAATLAGVYGAYQLLPEYFNDFYGAAWVAARACFPWLALIAPIYIVYVDRRQVEPEDAYAQLGGIAFGRFREVDVELLGQHALGWLVKAFFLPLMFVYLLDTLDVWWNADLSTLGSNFDDVFRIANNSFFLFDLLFAVIGYSLTLRLLDSQIRSTDPTFFGWVVCLVCYRPIWDALNGYTGYEQDGFAWSDLTQASPILHVAWGSVILLCECVYALSTVMFGLRFSNLTHRGIITTGPYRWSKHPAYVAKCLSFWLISVPFFPYLGWPAAIHQSLLLLLVNGIYLARAITEERHLARDPEYRAYQAFIREHGLFAKCRRLLLPRRLDATL